MTERSRVGAVVLAAGLASRFGGNKLLAGLDGRPVLQHVLDRIAAVGVGPTVVVLGEDRDAVRAAIRWRGEHVVINEAPRAGLSGSLRAGIDALPDTCPATLVVLGDQPRLPVDAVRALLATDLDGAIAAVPVYAAGGRGHPVLLARAAFRLVRHVAGDTGLRDALAARAAAVREVAVPGANPDIDTPDDLARLAGPSRFRG